MLLVDTEEKEQLVRLRPHVTKEHQKDPEICVDKRTVQPPGLDTRTGVPGVTVGATVNKKTRGDGSRGVSPGEVVVC